MDLQTRKLDLIAYLAQLQDESFITKIENYILREHSEKFKVFTIEELVKRIEKSETEILKLRQNWKLSRQTGKA